MNFNKNFIVFILALSLSVFATEEVQSVDVSKQSVQDAKVLTSEPIKDSLKISDEIKNSDEIVSNEKISQENNSENNESYTPVAVRNGEINSEKKEISQEESPKTITKVVYQPVYVPEPTPVRTESNVQTVYVESTQNSKDTITFDELRGFVPFKTSYGVQGFIGSYSLLADADADDYFDEYYGLTWRVGAFALFPLNEYTIGFRLGVLYEQSDAVSTEKYTSTTIKTKFKQSKIDVPLVFAFKTPRSSFMFEVGAQVSFPIKDEFKVTVDDESSKIDMLDEEFRNRLDWDIVMGFSLKANRFVGFNLQFNVGLTDLYGVGSTQYDLFNISNLSSISLMLGASFYIF